MTPPSLVWLHEYALCAPGDGTLKDVTQDCRFIHIWDDRHLQSKAYSLKRLAFIYQTLVTLPADIIAGETVATLCSQPETDIFIPEAADPFIHRVAQSLIEHGKTIQWLKPAPFIYLQREKSTSRFFNYWKQVEKTAFLPNAGRD